MGNSFTGQSQTDMVLDASAALERILEERYGAQGKGLHELVTSVEGKLAPELVKKVRYVATRRNKVVHERQMLEDPAAFLESTRDALSVLSMGAHSDPASFFHGRYALPPALPPTLWDRVIRSVEKVHEIVSAWAFHAFIVIWLLGVYFAVVNGWQMAPAGSGLGANLLYAIGLGALYGALNAFLLRLAFRFLTYGWPLVLIGLVILAVWNIPI